MKHLKARIVDTFIYNKRITGLVEDTLTVDQVRLLTLGKRWRRQVTAAIVLFTAHFITIEVDTDTSSLNSSPGAGAGPGGGASTSAFIDASVEVSTLAGTEAIIVTIIIGQTIKQSGDTTVIVHQLNVVQAIRGALGASIGSNQMNPNSSLGGGRTIALTTALGPENENISQSEQQPLGCFKSRFYSFFLILT